MNGQNREKNLTNGDWEIFRKAVSIAGRVSDDETGEPVDGVKVQVVPVKGGGSSDAPSDSATTSSDGHFHFVSLPEGEYGLTVSRPILPCASRKVQISAVTVSHDVKGDIKMSKEQTLKMDICSEDDRTRPLVMLLRQRPAV